MESNSQTAEPLSPERIHLIFCQKKRAGNLLPALRHHGVGGAVAGPIHISTAVALQTRILPPPFSRHGN